jgi:tetratricopeptide (TPR) repeat protein
MSTRGPSAGDSDVTSTRLDTALKAHAAGDLARADSLYRELLQQDPANADAWHLRGVIAHQRGDPTTAIKHIRHAIGRRPAAAIYHSNLGEALRADGQLTAALEAYASAIGLDPAFADAYGNLGATLKALGRVEEAIDNLRQAVRLNPQFTEAQMNLGVSLRELGQLDEAAACFRQAITANPGFAEAHVNLGNVMKELGQPEQALGHYGEAIRIQPGLAAAHLNMANLLVGQEAGAEARASYHRAFQLEHDSPLWNAPTLPELPSSPRPPHVAPIEATRFELLNRAEQVEHLISVEKLDTSFAAIATRYRSILKGFDPAVGEHEPFVLSGAQTHSIADFHSKVICYTDAPPVPGSALNANLPFARIEMEYLSSPVAVIHFDDFLSDQALRGLRDFCLESTTFFGRDRAGTLQSYLGGGFDCSLLFQIVTELKQRFPRVLGTQVLRNMWVYRYPKEGEGVNLHTDNGSVTFNFWITPDDANLLPQGSGLIVYAKEQPLDWDWARLNREKDDPRVQAQIRNFVGPRERITIPYRENRAVLFHSNLFHQSDHFRFRDDYRSRRMNVTLLFGDRGSDVRLKYVGS